MSIPDKLRLRPGMHIAVSDQKFDAGSIIQNFLFAVYGSSQMNDPRAVYISVLGSLFSLRAVNMPMFHTPDEYKNLTAIFDVSNYDRKPSVHSSMLAFLKPIVWFTHHCIVEAVEVSASYSVVFECGKPIGSGTTIRPVVGLEQSIGFSFTLPNEVFESPLLPQTRLKRVLQQFITREKKNEARPCPAIQNLRIQWRKFDDYHYSCKVV